VTEEITVRLVEALSLHQAGRLDEARRAYEGVLVAAPDNADARHLLGVVHYQQGAHAIALEHIRSAIALKPDASSYWSNLANVLRATGEVEEAVRACLEALNLDPDNIDASTNLANALLAADRPDEAFDVLTALVQAHPGHYAALNNLGLLHKHRGDSEAAISLFRRAVDLNPDYFDGHFNLGNLLFELGRHREATEPLSDAVALDALSAESHRVLGLALLKTDALDEALEQFVLAEAIAPRDPRVLLGVGTARQELGEVDEAEAAYRRVIALDPDNHFALNNLGTIHRQRGELGEGLALFDRAVARDPDYAEAHFNRGSVLSELGRVNEAEQSLLRACALDPSFAPPRESLVDLYERIGNPDKAELVIRRWREQLPDDPIARHLAAAHGGESVPSRCAEEYVQAEFDRAAKFFDHRLKTLDYRMPGYVAPVLAKHLPEARLGALTVLDAGCGTGLCARSLKPWAARLEGVDLSGKMLSVAAGLELYDELRGAELVADLRQRPGRYDVIVSMDVLIYFGDLEEPLEAAFQALKPGGLLVFSVEQADDADAYVLQRSGRFAHDGAYIRRLAAEVGFALLEARTVILRMERQVPVWGHLLELQRPDAVG